MCTKKLQVRLNDLKNDYPIELILNGSLRVNTKFKNIVYPPLIPNLALTVTRKTRDNCNWNNANSSSAKATLLKSSKDRVKSDVISNTHELQNSITFENKDLPNNVSQSNNSDTCDIAVKNIDVASGISLGEKRLNFLQSSLLSENSSNVKNFDTLSCYRKKCEKTNAEKFKEVSLVKEENGDCSKLDNYFSPVTPPHLISDPILNSLLDDTPITPPLECTDVNTLPSLYCSLTSTDELKELSFSEETPFSVEVLVESTNNDCNNIDENAKHPKLTQIIPPAKPSLNLEVHTLAVPDLHSNQDRCTGNAVKKIESFSSVPCVLSSSGANTLDQTSVNQLKLNQVSKVRPEELYDFHNDAELDVTTIVLKSNHQRKLDQSGTGTNRMTRGKNSKTLEETKRLSTTRLGKENCFIFSKKELQAGNVKAKSKRRKKQVIEEVVKKIYALHGLENTSTAVIPQKANTGTTIGHLKRKRDEKDWENVHPIKIPRNSGSSCVDSQFERKGGYQGLNCITSKAASPFAKRQRSNKSGTEVSTEILGNLSVQNMNFSSNVRNILKHHDVTSTIRSKQDSDQGYCTTDNTDLTKFTKKFCVNSKTSDEMGISDKDETNGVIDAFTTNISSDMNSNVETKVNNDEIDDVPASSEKSVFNMDILFPHLEKYVAKAVMKYIEQRRYDEEGREAYKKLKRRCEDVEKTFQEWDNFFCNVKPTIFEIHQHVAKRVRLSDSQSKHSVAVQTDISFSGTTSAGSPFMRDQNMFFSPAHSNAVSTFCSPVNVVTQGVKEFVNQQSVIYTSPFCQHPSTTAHRTPTVKCMTSATTSLPIYRIADRMWPCRTPVIEPTLFFCDAPHAMSGKPTNFPFHFQNPRPSNGRVFHESDFVSGYPPFPPTPKLTHVGQCLTTAPPPQLIIQVLQDTNVKLVWSNAQQITTRHATIESYQLFAYKFPHHKKDEWKKLGNRDVPAKTLPMMCEVNNLIIGHQYFFIVRGKDIYGRCGPFSRPCSFKIY